MEVMDAFVYRDGVDVPPDVTRVVVHRSVRVLPPKVFQGCEKLEEVLLHEGLGEIGDEAFLGCVSLRRLRCPSTVIRIGRFAFEGCKKLEEVQLNEGLKEIGEWAFCDCVSLRRLNCPSTVVRIGAHAFCDCNSLSVVEIAGILKVVRGAFADALHSRIQVPSRAFVVQRGNHRLVTDGTIAPTHDEFVLIAPGCLTALPESNLTELGNSIHTIVNDGEGMEEDRLDRVRQEVRREVRGEVSAILGLAFWKAKIDEAERAHTGAVNNQRENTLGRLKRAKVDIVLTQEARKGCRSKVEGKGKLIAQNVLPFLDGLWRKGSQGGP